MSGNDAEWLAKEVILPQLAKLEERMEKRDAAMWRELKEQRKCQTKIKVEAENGKGRLGILEEDMKRLFKLISFHIKDNKKHFDPYYNETTPHKLWRKRTEIGAGGGLAAAIIFLASQIIQLLQR